MGKVADLSVFTPGGQPGAPTPSEGLAVLRQNQTAFMETIGVMPPESLTIADGAISPTTAVCIVDTEGGAPADDLTIINATLSDGSTLHDGMVILLLAKNTSRVVTVKKSDAPNGVKTVDGKDIALSPEWSLVLQYVGGVWQQINVSAPLKPATGTTLGGVKVGDGLTMRDGVMSADLATDAEAGRVKASVTAAAGATPLGGVDGTLDASWVPTPPITLFNSRTVITKSNAAWTPPVTGWARVTVIGGGGAGGGGGRSNNIGVGGGQGGTTRFDSISAAGGSGGGGGGKVYLGGYAGATGGGGGGGAGKVVSDYIYLVIDGTYPVVIGAGGRVGSDVAGAGPEGGKAPSLDDPQYTGGSGAGGASSGGTGTTNAGYSGSGGSGGSNGTGYGGGGGGATYNGAVGIGVDGGKNGTTGENCATGGGIGGSGAVIIEYYDPAKEGA